MSALQLNLNDLTPAHLEAAKPFCGDGCYYNAPCIIGTLVPEGERTRLDNFRDSTIDDLISEDAVRFPDPDQEQDAHNMQRAFDRGDWDIVEELAGKYVRG